LNGYRLIQPRYGEQRTGEAVLVFVTETFTDAARVKSDGGHSDEFTAMKLNDMRDFQTGIYDYHLMTSTFIDLSGERPLGQPVKVSFSMQEWCGHQYAQWVSHGTKWSYELHSYWDGEADQQKTLSIPEGAIFGDSLPMVLRGVMGELLAAGDRVEVPFMERTMDLRFARREPTWGRAKIHRSKESTTFETPLGEFLADTFRVDWGSSQWIEYRIEPTGDRRLLGWESSTGERAVLTGTTRSQYWKQSKEGDESLLLELGLSR
jgi:hypothetical protein